jgi:hypothetical protein
VGWVAWDVFLLPSSFGAALFRYRLSRAVQTPKIEIKLAELATFDWEEVCSLHPYDGEFKHPRYGRTYHTPMRAANDGVWTLLFIGKDGGPTYVSGKCAFIRDFGCRSRSDAIFRIERTTDTCPFLSAIPTHGENQILSSGLP